MSENNKIQFLFNDNGEKEFAVVSIDVFNRLTETFEELEDIKAFDEAKGLNEETVSLDELIKEVNNERKDV